MIHGVRRPPIENEERLREREDILAFFATDREEGRAAREVFRKQDAIRSEKRA